MAARTVVAPRLRAPHRANDLPLMPPEVQP